MVSERQALSAWQDTLEEAIGVDEAAMVVDRVGDVTTRGDLRDFRDYIDRPDRRQARVAGQSVDGCLAA